MKIGFAFRGEISEHSLQEFIFTEEKWSQLGVEEVDPERG